MADLSNSSARPSLLVFADDWGRHPSSCQHLVKRLQDDFSILWVNTVGTRRVRANAFTLRRGIEKLKSWRKGIVQVARAMWVVDLPMLPAMGSRWGRALNRRLVSRHLNKSLAALGLDAPIVLTTLPYVEWMIRDVQRSGLIYYCTDDYSHWPGADRAALQAAERELCGEADLTLAVSDALLERLEKLGPCQYFPHGVDLEHFALAQSSTPPPELSSLPGSKIGFFGLIYEKLDFELLASIARRFDHSSLAMIGPTSYCPAEFRALANVHFFGQQPYADLPRWIAGLDVLLLPYVNDEMIRQSSPLKLRECLASGKPTVSVDVPEVRRYQPFVRVAGTHADFLQEVQRALEEGGNAVHAAERRAAVRLEGWDRRAADLRRWIDELAQRGRPRESVAALR